MESTNKDELDTNSILSEYHRRIQENSLYHCFKCNKPFSIVNKASSYMENNRHLCISCFPEEQHFTSNLNQMQQAHSSKTRINSTINLFYSALDCCFPKPEPNNPFSQADFDVSTRSSSKQSIQDSSQQKDDFTLYTEEHAEILTFFKISKLTLFYYLGINGELTIYTEEGFLTILSVKNVSCVQEEFAYLDEQNGIYYLEKRNNAFRKMTNLKSEVISAIFTNKRFVFTLTGNILNREAKDRRRVKKFVSGVSEVLDFSGEYLLVYKADNTVALLGEDLVEVISYSNTACLKTGCITSEGFVLLDTSGLCQILQANKEKPELLLSNFSKIAFNQGIIVGVDQCSVYNVELKTLKFQKMYTSTSLECALFKTNNSIIVVFQNEEVLITAENAQNIALIPISTFVSDLGGY